MRLKPGELSLRSDSAEEGLRWLKQAKRDLEDAIYLQQGERHNSACFMAQQSAEKAVKAFLYWSGEEIVLGHSASEIAARCIARDESLRTSLNRISLLDKYYIPTRYPNGLLDGGVPYLAYDRDDSQKAISITQEIISVIEAKI